MYINLYIKNASGDTYGNTAIGTYTSPSHHNGFLGPCNAVCNFSQNACVVYRDRSSRHGHQLSFFSAK